MTFPRNIRLLLVILLICLCLGGGVYLYNTHDAGRFLTELINEKTHPGLLLLSFLILPVVGAPISIFLVLLGIRFGPVYGMGFMLAGMLLHMLAAFGLAHSYIRPWLEKMAGKRNIDIPAVPPHRHIRFSILFMAIPGLPYTAKNYLLALSGVRFPVFLLAGWPVNALLGAPFIILGGAAAARKNFLILAIIIVAAWLIYQAATVSWKKYRNISASGKSS